MNLAALHIAIFAIAAVAMSAAAERPSPPPRAVPVVNIVSTEQLRDYQRWHDIGWPPYRRGAPRPVTA